MINYAKLKAMRESQQLRSQLCRISQKLFPGFTASMKMKPLDAKDVKRLHEILLCGYIDQIAMRCDDPNIYNNINTTTTGNISKVKFYLPLTACTFRESILNHPIFIHPESCLSRSSGRRDFPKFIVYGQLLMQSTADRTRSTNDGRTAKIHMRNLTAINESEQSIIARIGSHLCRWGKPMDHPPPFYCPQRHRVLCYAQPTFGDRQVDLPPVPVEYATLDSVNNSCGFSYASDCARHLAKAIVDGHVFPQMNQFAQFIRQSSSVLINPKLPVVHSKLMNLVVPLSQRKLCDREGLLAALREQPRFLLPGIMEWYHSECHTNLQTTWLSLSTM
jgi:ATP-dependent RNA helicase DHX37/DHR1